MLEFIFYQEPPVFSSNPPALITVSSITSSIRVNCSAKGSPLPNVTWYKNNVSMEVTQYVTKQELTSELVIGQFQPSDQATYTCVARNVYNDIVNTTSKIGEAPNISLAHILPRYDINNICQHMTTYCQRSAIYSVHVVAARGLLPGYIYKYIIFTISLDMR